MANGDGSLEPAQWINAVEQDLRTLVVSILHRKFGDDWLTVSGLTPDRLTSLRDRRDEEQARRRGGVVDGALIKYTQFYELGIIIRKHWSLFKDALGDRKRFDVYFDRLDHFRNPPAHSRDLLPFERALLAGMAGEMRNRVTIYRSTMGPDME